MFSKLLKEAQPWFSQHSTLIDWGPSVAELSKKEVLLPTITVFAEISLSAPVTRLLLTPKLTDQACNSRDIVEVPPTTTTNGIRIGTSKEGIISTFSSVTISIKIFDFTNILRISQIPHWMELYHSAPQPTLYNKRAGIKASPL